MTRASVTCAPAGSLPLLRRRCLLGGLTATAALSPGAAATPSRASFGVYTGGDPAEVNRFEAWLGRPVDQVLVFTDQQTWTNMAAPQWFIKRFAQLQRPALWSIAMIPHGASLESAASGAHNAVYRSAAEAFAATQPHPNGSIYIRPGWEFNGDWFPWAAAGHERAFTATFRHIVESFRDVSPRFRFEWNMVHGQKMDPESAFPGAGHVDVLGMDFYWMPRYLGIDPVEAFARVRDEPFGLRYLDALAAKYGKPIAFSEWGVQGNAAAPFVERVHDWIAARHVLYHNYWDCDADYEGRLSTDRWPATAAAFRQAFGRTRTDPRPSAARTGETDPGLREPP
jgi:hypothetical protein